MLKNVQEAKFEKILVPVSRRVLAPSALGDLSFDAFFTHILAHELSHGIGPQQIAVHGRATSPRQELKELYSAIEEAKADITGLFMLQYFYDHGILPGGPAAEHKLYTTFLASSFRTLRFGLNEAHGKGMAIQFNALLDAGAFVREFKRRVSRRLREDQTRRPRRLPSPAHHRSHRRLRRRQTSARHRGRPPSRPPKNARLAPRSAHRHRHRLPPPARRETRNHPRPLNRLQCRWEAVPVRHWRWFSVFIVAALPLCAQNPRAGFVLPPAPRLPGAITSVGFGSRLLQSIQGVPLGAGRGFRGGFGGYGAGAFTPYLLMPPYYPPPPDPGPMIVTAPPVVINQTFVAGGQDNGAPPPAPGPDVTSFTAPPASTDVTTPRAVGQPQRPILQRPAPLPHRPERRRRPNRRRLLV